MAPTTFSVSRVEDRSVAGEDKDADRGLPLKDLGSRGSTVCSIYRVHRSVNWSLNRTP